MHAVLMMPLIALKMTWDPDTKNGRGYLLPMNDLDSRLERGFLGSEGVLLQSSQVDHGCGMAKPGGA